MKANQSGNFAISPLSLRNALAVLSLGAAGETANEINQALQFPKNANTLIRQQLKLISSLNVCLKYKLAMNKNITRIYSIKNYTKYLLNYFFWFSEHFFTKFWSEICNSG